MTTDCSSEHTVTDGFFASLAPASPAPETTDTMATFKLMRVDAEGSFKICYCANLGGCDAHAKYNHAAGTLVMVDPLASVSLVSANAASLRVAVESRVGGSGSYIRCAVAEYEPSTMPTAAEVTDGLGRFGLGKGEAALPTKNGTNYLDIFFSIFLRAGQQYRVWCFDTSAQSFILPDSVGGAIMIMPQDIVTPRLTVFPSFLWSGATFNVELTQVFDAAVTRGRRLADTTAVRVNTGASISQCNQMRYADAYNMSVSVAGDVGKSEAVLVTNSKLTASAFRPFLCFWSGPDSTGIAMDEDEMTVQADQPSYTQRSITGQDLTKFYRGVFMQAIFTNAPEHKGLLHWVTEESYAAQGCAGVTRIPPEAQVVNGVNTSFFRINDPPGMYVMCYLGKDTESGTTSPFNGIGGFELTETVTMIAQDPGHPSTRNTVRLQLEVRMPGIVTCIAKLSSGDVTPADFDPDVTPAGRAALLVGPVDAGVDPEFPREFSLSVPLLRYQRSIGPMHVWCYHDQAEFLVFPDNSNGVLIYLQSEEPHASPDPSYIWNGTRFKLNLMNTPAIDSKRLALHEPPLPDDWELHLVSENGVRKLKYKKVGGIESQDEHPVYQAWLEGTGVDPCEGSDVKNAVTVLANDYTQTDDWLLGSTSAPFVCYWASEDSYPHLIAVLDILAQPPQFKLEINGQLSDFVYRGVDAVIRMQHTSPTEGRILVIQKSTYDQFGGACQDMGLKPLATRRLDDESVSSGSQQASGVAALARALQDQNTSIQCTNSPQRTSLLRVVLATDMFPNADWGVDLPPGSNCTRDYKLYWNPALVNTAVLADQERGNYFLVTSNVSVLTHFVKIRLLTNGIIPNASVAVVQQEFSKKNLANLSKATSWVLNTRDCSAQVLLSIASPMYEEGAESLPLSQYLAAALVLEGFNFFSVVWLPDQPTVIEKDSVCRVLQPPAPPPKRQESVFDIDKPGLGRSVESGMVWTPSQQNGTGSFLHSDPLGSYTVCYIGDESVDNPIFNPLEGYFESRDVLPVSQFVVPMDLDSTTVTALINLTSQIRGNLRCLALLNAQTPPTTPEEVFQPAWSDNYLGSSNLMQSDIAGTTLLVSIHLHQGQAQFITPSQSFAKAPPTIYVWCAHQKSTILYPHDAEGYLLDLRAREPPSFLYKQLNRTVTSVALTLQLEFTPIVAVFDDPAFPVNSYDEVQFSTRPAMPDGVEIDETTGAISGVPSKAGVFERTIVASSKNPPGGSTEVVITLNVDDVLGLQRRFVNVDSVLFSITPRSTTIFKPDEFVLLTKQKTSKFDNTPQEFFCIDHLKLHGIACANESVLMCTSQDKACCCNGCIMHHMKVQDVRITGEDCELVLTKKYHTRGMVVGTLTSAENVEQQTALSSLITADFLMPEEMDAELKAPVLFNIAIDIAPDEYASMENDINDKLKSEIASVVAISEKLIEIDEVKAGEGGMHFKIFFNVEPRCMEKSSMEMEFLAFGIDPQEGCGRIAPEEYMTELKEQILAEDSAIYSRADLTYLSKARAENSFTTQKVMFFCTAEPLWEYAAIAESEEQCPFDVIKFGLILIIGGTVSTSIVFGLFCYVSYEFASCSFLYKTRMLDVMTALLAVFTVLADYMWLIMLKLQSAHALHDTIFLAALCHLFLCFCINALSVRITITSYIQDTPWWRRNRKKLKTVLFLSCVTPRFFRMTRATIFGFDTTQIHFGTPSKMAVIFSNLGLVMLFQDIPQVLMQTYVWLIWGNQGPKISLICMFMGGQSIAVGILHHVFSRSQRAAYERVVKLLGVRRLTAGFFDVSSTGVTGTAGRETSNAVSLRKAGGGEEQIELGEDEEENEGPLDPTKLDPISAALYVSQMYEKETFSSKRVLKDESSSEEEPSDESDAGAAVTLYPKPIYEKLKKFYGEHDPTKLSTIGVGGSDGDVDEAKLDAELKAKFGQGLDSVE
jgi:hypothetical protein